MYVPTVLIYLRLLVFSAYAESSDLSVLSSRDFLQTEHFEPQPHKPQNLLWPPFAFVAKATSHLPLLLSYYPEPAT